MPLIDYLAHTVKVRSVTGLAEAVPSRRISPAASGSRRCNEPRPTLSPARHIPRRRTARTMLASDGQNDARVKQPERCRWSIAVVRPRWKVTRMIPLANGTPYVTLLTSPVIADRKPRKTGGKCPRSCGQPGKAARRRGTRACRGGCDIRCAVRTRCSMIAEGSPSERTAHPSRSRNSRAGGVIAPPAAPWKPDDKRYWK